MSEEIRIAPWEDGVGAALVVDGELVDFVLAPADGAREPGAIHKARFASSRADIGLGFLDLADGAIATIELTKHPPAPGAALLAQITTRAAADKPARASLRIALDGTHLSLSPTHARIDRSLRLARVMTADQARERLQGRLPPGFGATLRAAGLTAEHTEMLDDEIARMAQQWRAIEARLPGIAAPSCIHVEPAALRAARALLARVPDADVIASRDLVRQLQRGGVVAEPSDDGGVLLDSAGVGEALARARARRIDLASGGTVTIDHAQALTAIDVDSGAGSPGAANREAAGLIALQLALRDVTGPVLVDFIRSDHRERRDLLGILERGLEVDRKSVEVLGWTRGGLLEIMRGNQLMD